MCSLFRPLGKIIIYCPLERGFLGDSDFSMTLLAWVMIILVVQLFINDQLLLFINGQFLLLMINFSGRADGRDLGPPT